MQQTTQVELQQRFAGFDTIIRAWIHDYTHSGGQVHCGRGCRGCCSLAVNATFPEASFLAGIVTEPQAARVAEHVARLRAHLPECGDLKSFLRLHRRTIGFCPLLNDDGSCGVYERRPFSCRSLLATRESRWCSIDFGELTTEEKAAFVESLDRSVVAFPMHYAAMPQELGQEMEDRIAVEMVESCGFSLYGNLTVLIHLERNHGLSEAVAQGIGVTTELLARTGLDHPFLVTLTTGGEQ
jgi:Fe-S-cluster containining protein